MLLKGFRLLGQSGHNSLIAGDRLSDRRRELLETGVSIPDRDSGLAGQNGLPSKPSLVTGVRMTLPVLDVVPDTSAPFSAASLSSPPPVMRWLISLDLIAVFRFPNVIFDRQAPLSR